MKLTKWEADILYTLTNSFVKSLTPTDTKWRRAQRRKAIALRKKLKQIKMKDRQ